MKKYIPILLSISVCSLFGSQEYVKVENLTNEYIDKKYEIDKKIILNNNIKSKWDIISPINLSYSKNLEHEEEYSSISFSQDIFRSGGIFHSVKYSNILEDIDLKSLDIEQKNILLNIHMLLKSYQLLEINIEDIKLTLSNKKIELKTKEEQFKNGLIDIFTVNDLLITIETLNNSLIDLEIEKKLLLKDLKKYTKYNFKEIKLTHLPFPEKKVFLKENIINLDSIKIESLKKYKDLKVSEYLPKISIFASSTKYNEPTKEKYDSYGIRASLKIHPNVYFNNEKSRLDILKSKVTYEEKKYQMSNLYEFNKSKYDLITKKEINFNEIIKMFEMKIEALKKDVDLGNIAKYNVKILINSKKQYELKKLKLKLTKDLMVISLRKNMF